MWLGFYWWIVLMSTLVIHGRECDNKEGYLNWACLFSRLGLLGGLFSCQNM
jgi:hypothetical protein